MKTLRIALLGLVLTTGLVSGAYAHGPRVGVNVQFGYPAYVAPPVYYAPPPVYYAPPPPVVYVPPPFVGPYRSAGYYYGHDRGYYRGGHRHWRHHH